jgi:hypothetical protein
MTQSFLECLSLTIFSSKIDVKAVTQEVNFLKYLPVISKQVLKNCRKDLRFMRSFQRFHLPNEVVRIESK